MKTLAISTHPDDETLGCGGALLRHHARGDILFWVIVTQPCEPQWPREVIMRAASQVDQVAKAYGMENYFNLEFPTNHLDSVPQAEIIGRIRDVISDVKPDLVYVVHGGDVHTDHNATYTASMSVLKPFYMSCLGVRRVLCYETLSSTEAAPPRLDRVFMPNVFSEITPYMERKLEIMGLYETEAQSELLPRSSSAIRALARFRGSTIGVKYAEAFMLIREVN